MSTVLLSMSSPVIVCRLPVADGVAAWITGEKDDMVELVNVDFVAEVVSVNEDGVLVGETGAAIQLLQEEGSALTTAAVAKDVKVVMMTDEQCNRIVLEFSEFRCCQQSEMELDAACKALVGAGETKRDKEVDGATTAVKAAAKRQTTKIADVVRLKVRI